MRSISNLIVKPASNRGEDKHYSGPVACAVFIAALAVGVTGGALWLTSAVVHSNAQAAQMILYEQ